MEGASRGGEGTPRQPVEQLAVALLRRREVARLKRVRVRVRGRIRVRVRVSVSVSVGVRVRVRVIASPMVSHPLE